MRKLINLNSLTDIISNSIGMLILMSVAMLMQLATRTYEVNIPLEHGSDLAPVFFIARDGALVRVDHRPLFERALAAAAKSEEGKPAGRFPLGVAGLYGTIANDRGLVLHPTDTSGWAALGGIREDESPIAKTLDSLDPRRQYAYLFVYDERVGERTTGGGFEVLRATRERLGKRGVKVGWRPVDAEHPPHLCFWGDIAACRYPPMGTTP